MKKLKTSFVALKEELSKTVSNRIMNKMCNDVVTHINNVGLDMVPISQECDNDVATKGATMTSLKVPYQKRQEQR